MIDYQSLSNEELTILIIERFPQTFFQVMDENRYTAIALIENAVDDRRWVADSEQQ